MTLSGLIAIIFGIMLILGWAIFIIEMFLIDDIEDILNIFNWYNKRNAIVRHIMDYCFLFLVIFVFIEVVFLITVFIKWGDTVILW